MNDTEAQIQAYSQEVDISLLRENLRLTPTERLQQLENLINDLHTLRDAARKQAATDL
jgi:hypothetical protein